MASEIKKPEKMTDDERLALAHKLDQELDDFINSLEKKRYAEGWSEDTWEEEMAQHPFFMKSTPVDGQLSPLAEGLARLKYDADQNSPQELADNYREDGNFNYKHKNYRLAIMGYTEGIKAKCDNQETLASLYNNRAACHWELQNYRSALADSEKALTFKPDHKRAKIRAARSALKIRRYEQCIKHCEEYLMTDSNDKDVADLLQTARKSKVASERDQRKKERKERIERTEKDQVVTAIILRGIKLANLDPDDDIELSMLEPCLPVAVGCRVNLGDNGELRWPVLLLYPEFGVTDFIKDCPEDVPFIDQLSQLFPVPWDKEKKYNAGSVNVYFEGSDRKARRVDPGMKLGDLLMVPYYEVRAGTPAFFILVRDSDVERSFLKRY